MSKQKGKDMATSVIDDAAEVVEAPETPADDPLLTMAEVGRLFYVARSTAWRWANEGKIPSVACPSGLKKIRLSEVKRILGECVGNPVVRR